MISTININGLLLTSLFYISSTFAYEPDKDCVNWFNRAKIAAGSKDCELKCATLMTDMGTFMCPNQCEKLCTSKPNLLAKLIYYPGLTPAENDLLQKYPADALTVYLQKREAEKSMARNFPDQNFNDESDAFRHFIWAGLLTKELDRDKAKKFLDAHEADPDQPENERKMDAFNNNQGQSSAESLMSNKNWSIKNLESSGLNALLTKKLQVLKPGLPIPKEPK